MKPSLNRSPRAGEVAVAAVLFDTYGTVCDFFGPLKRAFESVAARHGMTCDSGAMAIAWRTAYMQATATQAEGLTPFRPLVDIHRENLPAVLARHLPRPLAPADIDELVDTWRRLEPWPDAVAGLHALRPHATLAPLSNGNFADMVALARHAGLPWDVILGSSLAQVYKPHPELYLSAVRALDLAPEQVLLVAAHQADLAFAAGHGLQTAFLRRPLEFGGPVKPREVQRDADYSGCAEVHVEGEWTCVVDSIDELLALMAAPPRLP